MSSASDGSSGDEYAKLLEIAVQQQKKMARVVNAATMFGMYYGETYLTKSARRQPDVTGYQWVITTLNRPRSCYKMFRMTRPVFESLHDTLVTNYGLKSTTGMHSIESLAMFLWTVGAGLPFSQLEDRFQRSTETLNRKFTHVLKCLNRLAEDIIKPSDPSFSTVHPRLQEARFSPHFHGAIGAIDGTHIPVVVPSSEQITHFGRYRCTTQNVMVVCDFDMRFTFVVAGWPGSVHDTRVFNEALEKYADKFPFPPEGKYYLVDSGYPNRMGFLSPYKGEKYHLPEFREGPQPRGKKEVFNHLHSSLRNVIERAFGVLKMKWRILLKIESYPIDKQAKIIIACMALHNFIRESALSDELFDMCDQDEDFVPCVRRASSSQPQAYGQEERDMNAFRDSIADALMANRE
ncbi:unnamed protein product [Urochloa humidicola]